MCVRVCVCLYKYKYVLYIYVVICLYKYIIYINILYIDECFFMYIYIYIYIHIYHGGSRARELPFISRVVKFVSILMGLGRLTCHVYSFCDIFLILRAVKFVGILMGFRRLTCRVCTYLLANMRCIEMCLLCVYIHKNAYMSYVHLWHVTHVCV